MSQTVFHSMYKPVKRLLPRWLSAPIRSIATAFIMPVAHSYKTGHFKSSFKMAAVSKSGEPLPWYSYPSIDFLKCRNYDDKTVLEFGGGQSTLWWAKRAKKVVTLEGDRQWYEKIKNTMPENVDLHYVSAADRDTNVSEVTKTLAAQAHEKYDVIIIDGLYRYEMIDIACKYLADDGVVVCDDAAGYYFYEGFKDREMNRVDFHGNVPGVVLPHSTSIYFNVSSFLFDPKAPFPSRVA